MSRSTLLQLLTFAFCVIALYNLYTQHQGLQACEAQPDIHEPTGFKFGDMTFCPKGPILVAPVSHN